MFYCLVVTVSVVRALVVTAVGVAHFAFPQAFEPLNRWLGFGANTRQHVYVNGAIETTIGLTSAAATTRTASRALGIAYGLYLATHALRSRSAATRASV